MFSIFLNLQNIYRGILLHSTISTLFFVWESNLLPQNIKIYKFHILKIARGQYFSPIIMLLVQHKHILYFAKKVLFTAYLYFLSSRRSHSLLELLEPLDVGGLGLLRLLLENVMALGHTPGVRLGQWGTEGPAPGRLQTLPVFSEDKSWIILINRYHSIITFASQKNCKAKTYLLHIIP